ncbi:hypothetical protein [Pseudoduganella sp. OTU4001]|uniref:hypothetical protein n=1 Tax=Pseudoduganella sp. OTU4001 TaxID=3043854 RepID=UPI00313B0AEF
MVSLNSINSLQNAVAFAERKVQQGRDQVAQDEDRLDESRAALERNQQELGRTKLERDRAQAQATPTLATPRLDRAIEQRVPSDALPKAPTLNTLGQTIGKLINVEA